MEIEITQQDIDNGRMESRCRVCHRFRIESRICLRTQRLTRLDLDRERLLPNYARSTSLDSRLR